MNRRTMLGSCLGFLGAFLGLSLERDVIPAGYMTDKAGNKWRVCKPERRTHYYRRITKVKSFSVDRLEYFRMVRSLERYKQQSARDYKELRGLA